MAVARQARAEAKHGSEGKNHPYKERRPAGPVGINAPDVQLTVSSLVRKP